MVSLKKESVIMEITPVHLMSEEEADKKFRLSREKSVSGRADGKSVTPDNTAERFVEVSDKTHTKKRKHNTGNNAKTHIVSFFSKVVQNIRDTDYEVLAMPCVITLSILACVAVIVMLVNVFEPVRPVADNLEISTYETSGIYKFTISDELKVNNSEKIYCISIDSIGTVKLAESEYEKYLGGDANAVSVTEYGIDAICYGAFGKTFYCYGRRFSFPWSESSMPFSEEEKEYFAELICGDYENGNNILKKMSLDSYKVAETGAA